MFSFGKICPNGQMRFVKNLAIALALVLGSACQQTPPKESMTTSTSQAFLTTWETQLDKYREEFSAKDALVRKKSAVPIQAELASSADPWNTLVTKVSELSSMITEEYVIAGRGTTIEEFIKHMKGSL